MAKCHTGLAPDAEGASSLNNLPPIIPYVMIRMSIFGANTDRTNASVAMILPVIHTGRQPYLFVRALTIGPEIEQLMS